jgi:hypothetical protein
VVSAFEPTVDYVSVAVAALEVAELTELVKTARSSQPFSKPLSVPDVKVVDVAPEMLDHVLPPFVESCHWIVGVGVPLAADVKVSVLPEV